MNNYAVVAHVGILSAGAVALLVMSRQEPRLADKLALGLVALAMLVFASIYITSALI